MKVVFVGPSLPDAASFARGGIKVFPPAVQGDVLRATEAGATAIGIIDGGFEYTAPVWHKEILYALSKNVSVLGAASMGALRAVECQAFGMIGIGRIFDDYASGATVDDADVALLHGPAELGYAPLTLPLVNVRATLDRLEAENHVTHDLRLNLEGTAGQIFFKERTWRSVVANCAGVETLDRQQLLSLLVSNATDQKRMDALDLIDALHATTDSRADRDALWRLHETFIPRI